RKCILYGLYVMTTVTILSPPATDNTPAVPAHKVPETFKNITLENHAHFDAKAKVIHMILSGIRNDIYSTHKNKDTSSKNRNENQTSQFVNQRMGFGHMAKECRTPKRVKDYAYHKEKMMLCKQEEKGVHLSADQEDWLDDTDEELNKQELEAHYIQHFEQPESIDDMYVVEKIDSNVIPDSSDM
nr:hypothetical protein [Tanacetum cinerariifolium]